MSITEALRLETLERKLVDAERHIAEQADRIEAIEARLAGDVPAEASAPAAPESLQVRNATRHAKAERLRAAIAEILGTAAHPDALTAKEVARALGAANFEPLPARRTIAEHLAQLRRRGNTRDATSRHRND